MHESRQTLDDASLLGASAAGDRDAFALFYRRHLAAVVAVLLAETADRELAADLAAEVFAAALLAAGRYRPGHQTALPWLFAIARHKARDSRRRGRAEQRARRRLGIPREPVLDEDLERVDELAGQAGGILGLVERFPEEQRAAVRARVIEQRDYADIASEIGSSEQAVRQRVSRALSRLRRQGVPRFAAPPQAVSCRTCGRASGLWGRRRATALSRRSTEIVALDPRRPAPCTRPG